MTRYSVNNNTHMGLAIYIFLQIQIIWSVNTPRTASNFRHLLSCCTIVLTALIRRRKRQKQNYMEDFGSGGLFEEQNKKDNF